MVDHAPALGNTRFDLAACVEADEALCGRVEQEPGRGVQRTARRVGQYGIAADSADRHRAVVTTRAAPGERGERDQGDRANHQKGQA
ncbi:hypothetical protein [Sphingomonas sp. Ant H11]|uniref:hypothetical protein n=1 Tax=Sphingomonas sp. Ant H11 TaxID=1564113 RepID=UPI001E32FD3D|nr:hypothetical protein [Sphingomonas sp. Ant H11]